MMKSQIKINIFIDALGFELLQENNGFLNFLPERKKIEMQFGYSSAAIPTILTGQQPDKHKHFSYFFYNPLSGPFRNFSLLSLLELLPAKLNKWWKLRNVVSRGLKKILGYSGYFQIYSVDFRKLLNLDYSEKTDLFSDQGIGEIDNIAKILKEQGKKHFITHWSNPEEKNFLDTLQIVKEGKVDFIFVYAAELDGLLHSNRRDSEIVKNKLEYYHNQIKEIYNHAHRKYGRVEINVMSDHGMTPFSRSLDVWKSLKDLNLKEGKDYFVVLDSTMARFWYFNHTAKLEIRKMLANLDSGEVISDKEKKEFGICFKNSQYGDDIFLVSPGVQIVPSDMGQNPLLGMHGYHPKHKHSYASLISSELIDEDIIHVKDFFKMMITQD